MMTPGRMVPVGSNPKMFVRTDRVIGMEIVTRYAGTGEKYILTIHMEGMPSASVFLTPNMKRHKLHAL